MTARLTPDAAFVAAVLDSPDDQAVRLIFADFLMEQGNPRGEFIHVQCRLAELPLHDPRRPALERRERQLLADHAGEWAAPFGDCRPIFRCGFIEGLTLDAKTFLERAGTLFHSVPLKQVWLHRSAGLVEAVAASPHLARLTDLNLSANSLNDDEVRAVADSPHVSNLTRLSLTGTDLTDAGLRSLFQSGNLTRLSELNVQMNRIGLNEPIGECRLGRLTSLNLFSNALGPRGGSVLIASPWLDGLTHLNLGRNRVGNRAARDLNERPWPGRLKSLNLSENEIRDDGALALLDAPHGERLDRLVLRGNLIGSGIRDRLRSRFGSRLTI